jgi:uncharacterized protein (DUF2141 family)
MSLIEPPEEALETGRFELVLYVDEDGDILYDFDFEGLTTPAVLGYLTAAMDDLRAERAIIQAAMFEDEWDD